MREGKVYILEGDEERGNHGVKGMSVANYSSTWDVGH